jgi:hypothetical protein
MSRLIAQNFQHFTFKHSDKLFFCRIYPKMAQFIFAPTILGEFPTISIDFTSKLAEFFSDLTKFSQDQFKN